MFNFHLWVVKCKSFYLYEYSCVFLIYPVWQKIFHIDHRNGVSHLYKKHSSSNNGNKSLVKNCLTCVCTKMSIKIFPISRTKQTTNKTANMEQCYLNYKISKIWNKMFQPVKHIISYSKDRHNHRLKRISSLAKVAHQEAVPGGGVAVQLPPEWI